MTQGSLVSRVAAIMGSTAFLAPLMVTSPRNGTPPLMSKLSMDLYVELAGLKCCSCNQDSWALSVVFHDALDNPVFVPKKIRHPLLLAVPKFEHNLPTRPKKGACPAGQVPIKVQAVRTPLERAARIVASP